MMNFGAGFDSIDHTGHGYLYKFNESNLFSTCMRALQLEEISNNFEINFMERRMIELETVLQILISRYAGLENRLCSLEDMPSKIQHKYSEVQMENNRLTKTSSVWTPPPPPLFSRPPSPSNLASNSNELKFSSLITLCSDLYEIEIDEAKLDEDKQARPANLVPPENVKREEASTAFCCRVCKHCSNPVHSCCCCSADYCLSSASNKSYSNKKETKSNKADNFRDLQRMFNKRVKYEVNKAFGKNYLAEHQVRELDLRKMLKIKKRVLSSFSPFPLSVKKAWENAMNSLRQDRHQLKKKKEK